MTEQEAHKVKAELRRLQNELYAILGAVEKLIRSIPDPEPPPFQELHTYILQNDGTVRICEP
jgi:hypothetical protein